MPVTAGFGQLGPLGVFLLMLPESACIPVPSEATLMCAGFAVRQGWMPFWVAVAAATAGNLAGSLIAYGVGMQLPREAAGCVLGARSPAATGSLPGTAAGRSSLRASCPSPAPSSR